MASKILVIEDEETVRLNLVELLEAEGYECIGAKDGEAGIRAAWSEIPDLILCDVLMPNVDGFGVLASLSQDPATSTIPFIFLTARTERNDQRIGMELGADDYVTKPFTRSGILNAIEKRLEKRSKLISHNQRAFSEMHQLVTRRMPENLLSPLSLILSSAENMATNVDVRSDMLQVQKTSEVIVKSAHRLIDAIENYSFFLDLELIEADGAQIEQLRQNSVANAGWEIKSISRIMARYYEREGDLFIDTVDAQLIIAAEHLQKLLAAVLDNAFRYSIPGSPVQITGRLKHAGVYTLRIHDSGQGMYPEQVAGLMHAESFDRLRFVEPHFGLGWMLVRKLVDLYGGNVSLQSRLGEGTLVELEFGVEGS